MSSRNSGPTCGTSSSTSERTETLICGTSSLACKPAFQPASDAHASASRCGAGSQPAASALVQTLALRFFRSLLDSYHVGAGTNAAPEARLLSPLPRRPPYRMAIVTDWSDCDEKEAKSPAARMTGTRSPTTVCAGMRT